MWDAGGWRGFAAGKNMGVRDCWARPRGARVTPAAAVPCLGSAKRASKGGEERRAKRACLPEPEELPAPASAQAAAQPWAPELSSALVPELRGFQSVHETVWELGGPRRPAAFSS